MGCGAALEAGVHDAEATPAPAAAAACGPGPAAARQHLWQRQLPAPMSAAPAQQGGRQQRPIWQRAGQAAVGAAQAPVGGPEEGELGRSPSGSLPAAAAAAAAGSFRPIVRPPHAQPGQPPLRPAWQAHAVPAAQQRQQVQGGCPAAAQAAGGGGGWKPPAAIAPGAAGRRLAVQAAARAAPAPAAAGWNREVDGTVQLGWPGAEESARPARRVAVPDGFAGCQQYVLAWSNALREELNLRWVQGWTRGWVHGIGGEE